MALPDNPYKRELILVLTQTDVERLEYEPEGHKIWTNDAVSVLSASSDADNPLVRQLRSANLVRPGKVLLRSPYHQDQYEELDVVTERFPLDKYMLFSSLCQLLGAKRVKVNQVEDASEKVILKADADGTYKGVGAELEATNERHKRLERGLTLSNQFSGGKASPKEATDFLKDYGLWHDNGMKYLVDMRKRENNPLEKYELVINLSQETQNKLDIAASLNVPVFLGIDADFSKYQESTYQYEVTIEVEF